MTIRSLELEALTTLPQIQAQKLTELSRSAVCSLTLLPLDFHQLDQLRVAQPMAAQVVLLVAQPVAQPSEVTRVVHQEVVHQEVVHQEVADLVVVHQEVQLVVALLVVALLVVDRHHL
ncbi:MAG: hypothetical protein BWY68_00688 [bacterium ADurb.Bin400]|nr:MAG: hypothetical protein BWY68_00688 [bacterium ADurb.Bin400]